MAGVFTSTRRGQFFLAIPLAVFAMIGVKLYQKASGPDVTLQSDPALRLITLTPQSDEHYYSVLVQDHDGDLLPDMALYGSRGVGLDARWLWNEGEWTPDHYRDFAMFLSGATSQVLRRE